MTGICVLGSGSRGNCIYIGTDNTKILIDAGLSGRQTKLRLAEIGVDIHDIDAVLISHEHTDHTNGLTMTKRHPNMKVYFNRRTAEEHQNKKGILPENISIFSTGEPFDIGDFRVNPFGVLHDAVDPVGFELQLDDIKICSATDLGFVTRLVTQRLQNSDYLILESNHDVDMLKLDYRRPWSLKQRILGKNGHLSNEAAGDCITQALSEKLKTVFLAHLSSDCNKPELALSTVSERLEQEGAGHIQLEMTDQATISTAVAF